MGVKYPNRVTTRINALLRAAGHECRLIRGEGYYYLKNYEGPDSSIMVYYLEPNEEDFQFAKSEVNDKLVAIGAKTI